MKGSSEGNPSEPAVELQELRSRISELEGRLQKAKRKKRSTIKK